MPYLRQYFNTFLTRYFNFRQQFLNLMRYWKISGTFSVRRCVVFNVRNSFLTESRKLTQDFFLQLIIHAFKVHQGKTVISSMTGRHLYKLVILHVIRMSHACHSYLLVCYSYFTRISIVCHSYVNLMYTYAICYVVVCHSHGTHISFVCHLYELVCHSYTTHMYLYVIRMSLVCHLCVTRMYSYVTHTSVVYTRISFVYHLYALVCESYVTRMYSCVTRMSLVWTRMSLVCVFNMNQI